MTPAELLVELRARGASVVVAEPDRLRITAPAGTLDDALRQAIAAKKPALIQLLRTTPDATVPAGRRAWSDELIRDVHRWLSVHPPDVWTAAQIGERIAPLWKRLETLLDDYERTGEPGDRKAAVYAANAIAATAARAEREWLTAIAARQFFAGRTTRPQRESSCAKRQQFLRRLERSGRFIGRGRSLGKHCRPAVFPHSKE